MLAYEFILLICHDCEGRLLFSVTAGDDNATRPQNMFKILPQSQKKMTCSMTAEDDNVVYSTMGDIHDFASITENNDEFSLYDCGRR